MNAQQDKHMPWPARAVLVALQRLQAGSLTLTLPDGATRRFAGADAGPDADLTVKDWSLFGHVLRGGDMAFAEAYIAGKCETDDLAALLTLGAVNEAHIEQAFQANWWRRAVWRLLHLRRDNSRAGAKRNIQAHYDLGNDFYALWLDPSMTYSSGIYEGGIYDGDASRGLQAAQDAKYARILDRLGVRQGDSVLEIGCGWGGFAEAAAKRGARVKAITISNRQLDYARERMAKNDLSHTVDIDFRDYRDLQGSYDHIVSIEMIEAVGERYWPDYFTVLRRHLKPGGKALVQAITIADKAFEQYRRSTDFIQRYVFPGGMLLSPTKLEEQAKQAGLRLADAYEFGKDYARTLAAWLERFDTVREKMRGMGFDDKFTRMWRYYLAYCIAGFASGRTDVLQAELVHA
ncbi:MAG: cyclopropane-fatty-acyl-phospholipid synthase family protein [Rhodospirillales bacterium]